MADTKSSGTPAPGRRRLDWEAIERDYRTGKFTLRELEAKHGANNATIARRAAKDGWSKDLAKAVRQATNAGLIAAAVQQESSKAQQNTATAVLAAAEVNTQVILRHRAELKTARILVMELLAELQDQRMLDLDKELLAQVLAGNADDIKQVGDAQRLVHKALATGSRAASAKTLSDALTRLHTGERQAFSLDAAPEEAGENARPLAGLSTDELRAALRGDS